MCLLALGSDHYNESFWLPLYPVRFLFIIKNVLSYLFILATYMTGHAGFQMFLWPLRGKVTLLPRLLVVVRLLQLVVLVFKECLELPRGGVTLCCRLLVIVRSLCLVILFFEECSELHWEELLFIVGCWLLCDCYVWSYWFLFCLTWAVVVSPI